MLEFFDNMLRKGESQLRIGSENPQQQHFRTSWVQFAGVKFHNIPQIEWACPLRFVVSPNWKMEAGSESQETRIQLQRESRIAEAIYLRDSDIPANPSVASDALGFYGDDSRVPIVPLDAINDDTLPDDGAISLITSKPNAEVDETTTQQPLTVPPLGPQVNGQALTFPPLGLQVNGQPLTIPPQGPQVNGQPLTVPPLGPQVNIQPLTVPPRSPQVNIQPLTVPPRSPQLNGQPLTVPSLGPQVKGQPLTVPSLGPQVNIQPLTIPPVGPQVNGQPLTIPPVGPQVNSQPLTIPPVGPQVNSQPLLHRDEVTGTAVALVALIKSKESGSQIDLELLIQLLRNPGMLDQMMIEHGLSTNHSSIITRDQRQQPPSVPVSVPSPTRKELHPVVTGPNATENMWSPSVPFAHSMSREVKSMIDQIHRNSGSQSHESTPAGIKISVPGFSSNSSKPDVGKVRKLINEFGVPLGADSANPASSSSPSGPNVIKKDSDYYRKLISKHGVTRENLNPQGPVKRSGTSPVESGLEEKRPPCVYFNSPRGCRRGSSCWFHHIKVYTEEPSTKRMKLCDGHFGKHT